MYVFFRFFKSRKLFNEFSFILLGEAVKTVKYFSISSKYSDFTPKESQIAVLVKQGKTSKEIASLLDVSSKAIDFHRNNIRAKLGLHDKKVNLRSFLASVNE